MAKKPEYSFPVEGPDPNLGEPPKPAVEQRIKKLETKIKRLKRKHKPSKRKPSAKQRIARRRASAFRGTRKKEQIETISRVYSQRPETTAISASVAYKPYTTQQLPSKESTAIYRTEYDPNTKQLKITFWGYKQRYVGSTYVYYQVPYDLWTAFIEAGSKGRFFYYNIRTVYSYTRVR